jgi:hypothetical protein
MPPLTCVELSNLDNDTGAIDFVRWGAIDVPSSPVPLGDIELDDFESRRSLSIGPLDAIPSRGVGREGSWPEGPPPDLVFEDSFTAGTFDAWSLTGAAPPPPVLPECQVPAQLPTVQAAVSDPGCARVVVAPGTYAESVVVSRSLTLEGSSALDTQLARPLKVVGGGTVLALSGLAVDVTGCYPAAVEVAGGARVEARYGSTQVTVANSLAPPGPPCPLFADGFESVGAGAWSAAVP